MLIQCIHRLITLYCVHLSHSTAFKKNYDTAQRLDDGFLKLRPPCSNFYAGRSCITHPFSSTCVLTSSLLFIVLHVYISAGRPIIIDKLGYDAITTQSKRIARLNRQRPRDLAMFNISITHS